MICLILLTFIVFTGIAFASDANSTDYELAESADKPLTDTISVDGDTFKDIQDKVDEANDGDTIYLNGKTYIGNGTQITLNKSLTIDGSSPGSDSKAVIDANDSSRAFYANESYNIVLKNIVFQKLNVPQVDGGGIIYHTGGNLSIMNCEVKDVNISTEFVKGALIFIGTNSNLLVDTFEVHNIYIKSNDNLVGTIIAADKMTKINISNLKNYDNTIYAKCSSGAIRIDQYCEFSISNLESYNNTYTYNGKSSSQGLIYISAYNKGNISNVTFKDNTINTASEYSGALLYATPYSTVCLTNCISKNNNISSQSYVNGALVFIGNKGIFYMNNTTSENDKFSSISSMFGIHQIGEYTTCNITNTNIINDTISASGCYGFFYKKSYNTTHFENITIIGNTINNKGATLYGFITLLYSVNATINSIIIKNNTLNSSSDIYASIMAFPRSNVNISNINITDNNIIGYSTRSGGISVSTDSNANIYNVNFTNNKITGRELRGECIEFQGNLLNISNVRIENNTASSPSAHYGFIDISKCLFNISKITIKNNDVYNSINTNPDPYDTSFHDYGMMRVYGIGKISNSNFSHNRVTSAIGAAIQLCPTDHDNPIVVEYCIFENNTVSVASKDHETIHFMNHGGAICVSGGDNGSAIIRNSTFINNANSQGGAITPHNNCIIEYCRFINNTATKFYGGAISTEDGLDMNNANITIRGCYFENNAASIGGAIQAKGDYVKIYNCTFKENKAVQGGAVFLEGNNLTLHNCTFIDNHATDEVESYGVLIGQTYLPQVSSWDAFGGAVYIHGNEANLKDNIFKYNSAITPKNATLEDKGGAIYIYGDNATVLTSHFDDNFAHSGNGSAVYIMGVNAKIDSSEFYNHDAGRGTVFIRGSQANVLNSIFKANTATKGGAGIYSIGNHSIVDNVTFENNNATVHGGAIHSQGDYIRILNSKFISNNAHPSDEDMDNGLGGAIYTKGDYNDIAYCDFDFNTARNGSAIYNRGKELTIEDCEFHYNQAYSYHLEIKVDPKISNYTPNNKIQINITHIGGDNIINAIYNDGSHKNIFFYNVTYEHSSTGEGKRNSGLEKVNPVESAEKSNNGELIYQDSREDLQIIDVIVAREQDTGLLGATEINGEVIKQFNGQTGLYGNISFTLTGDLKPGKYNVYASHPDDRLYKGIENLTSFEISPQVNLKITKDSDRDSYFVGDTATYTITVKSQGTDAHDIRVEEIIPEEFEIIDYTASKGEFTDNVWIIEILETNATATLTLRVKVTTNGTFTNIVNVTSQENDTNTTDNVANKTVTVENYVDLTLTKTADIKNVKVGDEVIWTITVTNNGTINATGVKATDKLPKSLEFISYSTTKGQYNPNTGIWDIGNVEVNETVTLNITTKVLNSGKITNTASVTSNEEDKNTTNNQDTETIEANKETKPIKKDNPKKETPNKKDTETIEANKETKPIKKDNPKKETPNKKDTNKTENPVEKSKIHKVSDKNQTGNPMILLMLAIVAIPLRKIKK